MRRPIRHNNPMSRGAFLRGVGAAAVGAGVAMAGRRGLVGARGAKGMGAVTGSSVYSNDQSGLLSATNTATHSATATFVGNQAYGDPNGNEAGLLDYYGDPIVIDTKITKVRFCNGTKRTDEPGGIVDTVPEPVVMSRNSVTWHEYILLLSGIGSLGRATAVYPNPYTPYVYGPIDANGVDQSSTSKHPREGLKYLPLRIRFPASGWNGKLIYTHSGSHGDITYDLGFQELFGDSNIDEVQLMKEGWAIASLQHNGLVANQQNPWAHDQSYFGRDTSRQSFYARRAEITADGTEKDSGCGGWFDSYDNHVVNVTEASITRDVTNLIKNLLYNRLGSKPSHTYLMGGSGVGYKAFSLNNGRHSGPSDMTGTFSSIVKHPQLDSKGLTPRTGGNFVEPYKPEVVDPGTGSNKIFDGFLLLNSIIGGGRDDTGNKWESREKRAYKPDHEYPMSAPTVFINGVRDEKRISPSPLRALHHVSLALNGPINTQYQETDLNNLFRIYHVQSMVHHEWDANCARHLDGGMYYYDRGEEGIGLNTDGVGNQLKWIWEYLPIRNLPNVAAALIEQEINAPKAYPLMKQCLRNLVAWAENGTQPPESVLDEYIMDTTVPAGQKILPPLPLAPAACQADLFSTECLAKDGPVVQDCIIDMGSWYYPSTMSTLSEQAVQYAWDLKQNGLFNFNLQPIVLPDDAARLGLYVSIRNSTTMSPFTEVELVNGYTDPAGNTYAGWTSHGDYVQAVKDAVQNLTQRGLFDQLFGQDIENEAAQSPYPARKPKKLLLTEEEWAEVEAWSQSDLEPEEPEA